MMNSHITSFLVGMAKGEGSDKPTPCPCKVKFASLTPPPIACLQLQPQNPQQIHPQDIHKMPVMRGVTQGAAPQIFPSELADHIGQTRQAAQYMQPVHRGEDVEKRATWIAGQI